MRFTKKVEMLEQIRHFSQCFQEFPEGEVVVHDPPSFLVNTEKGTQMGLVYRELASSYRNTGIVEEKRALLEHEIVENAQEQFHKEHSAKLFVDIAFRDSVMVGQKEYSENEPVSVNAVAGDIARIVSENLPDPGTRITIERDSIGSKNFPTEVEYISVWRREEAKNSVWSPGYGFFIPPPEPIYIQELVNTANRKIEIIPEEAPEKWLLFVDDGSHGANTYDLKREVNMLTQPYISLYDRIFIFRDLHNEVFELKALKL